MALQKWDWTRLAAYGVFAAGSALSLTGLADFDPATGVLDPRPIALALPMYRLTVIQ